MLSKEKRRLIDIACFINMCFCGLLTLWLFMIFEPSFWFVSPFFGTLVSFIVMICNEPDYIEDAEILNKTKGCGNRIFDRGDGKTIGVCGEDGMICFCCSRNINKTTEVENGN